MLFFCYAHCCFLILFFNFPPLYANRSNAIGGEGRFFYVSTAFAPISATSYNFQVCNVRKKKQKLHTSALCVYEGVGGPPLGTHNAGV